MADGREHVVVTAGEREPVVVTVDQQDQVVVTFERRDYVLTPSPGEVIMPADGRMIHHDPACLHLTNPDELPRFPDPDRLLWRRLIDSAPSDDTAGRTGFARSIGLLNGAGSPLVGPCGCVLRAVSPTQAAALRPWPLDDALAAFDRDRYTATLRDMEAAAEAVCRDFPGRTGPPCPWSATPSARVTVRRRSRTAICWSSAATRSAASPAAPR